MTDAPDFAALKTRERAIRDSFPATMGLRVHRAISWIGRAEACGDDNDARFIFLWIAFNAAYADETAFSDPRPGERTAFLDYFRKAVSFDRDQRIYDAIWKGFSGPIRVLMGNKFVFGPFWSHHNGLAGYEDWEQRLQSSIRVFGNALQNNDTAKVLNLVFDRLYVLRNQIVHGGSTWNSSVNRGQVRDGAAILGFLMPVFVDIMMDHPNEDWGTPFYPAVS